MLATIGLLIGSFKRLSYRNATIKWYRLPLFFLTVYGALAFALISLKLLNMTAKLLSFLLILLLSQCDRCKEEVKPIAEIDKLPPATQSGKFTFGCLINGKAFVAKHSGKMSAIYQQGFLQFGADNEIEQFTHDIYMVVYDPIEINKMYFLAESPKNSLYLKKYTGNSAGSSYCYYDFNNTLDGYVIFTRLDRQKFIVSGKFEFTTVVPGCDTIRVTDGRFDMEYIP